jgi:hypothetical protein
MRPGTCPAAARCRQDLDASLFEVTAPADCAGDADTKSLDGLSLSRDECIPPPLAGFGGAGVCRSAPRLRAGRSSTIVSYRKASPQKFRPPSVGPIARKAREWIRFDDGGYRRDRLRALAQRVEVADDEVRIMGSKLELLQTLVAASSGKSGAFGVWRSRFGSEMARG